MSISEKDIEKIKAKIKHELEPFFNKILSLSDEDRLEFGKEYRSYLTQFVNSWWILISFPLEQDVKVLHTSFKEQVFLLYQHLGMVESIGNWTTNSARALEVDAETFPNYSGECTDRIYHFERDPIVVSYFKSEEATSLREAYIAYLINEDLNFLRYMKADKIEQELPKLKSTIEFAFFEGVDRSQVCLFSKDGMSKFFLKYSGIEYYFTGMFVNNLLWNKKTNNN